MMDHFFTFVTKHENVEFRELMDEKNPSHCIRIILKDSRKVFFFCVLDNSLYNKLRGNEEQLHIFFLFNESYSKL